MMGWNGNRHRRYAIICKCATDRKNGKRWGFRGAVKDYRKTYYSCSDYFPWGISVCAEEKATIYIGGRKCQNEKK